MALTDDTLEQFSRSCACCYCKRYGSWEQLDDAQQDAALFLLAHRDKWQLPEAKLKRRAVMQLVRNYQERHKLRTKQPLRLQQVEDVDSLAGSEVDCEDEARRDQQIDAGLDCHEDPRWLIIQTALRQPDVGPYKEALVEIVEGNLTRKEIAARHGITQGRLSQIFAHFKAICQRLEPTGGAQLVDTLKEDATAAQRAAAPLFYQD